MLAPAPDDGSNTPSLRSLDPTEGFFVHGSAVLHRDGSPNIPFTTKADAVRDGWTAACAERVDLYVHRLDGTMHRYLSRVDGTNPERDEE